MSGIENANLILHVIGLTGYISVFWRARLGALLDL